MTHVELAVAAAVVAGVVVAAALLYSLLKISAATADRPFVDLPEPGSDDEDAGHGPGTSQRP